MFIYKIISVNVNGIRNCVTQTLLKKFLFNEDIDIALLQEVNDNNLDFLFPQYDYVSNVGEKLRGTAIIYRKQLVPTEIEQSPCGRITSLTLNKIRIINIYAPSGSNKKSERNLFFTHDLLYYLRHTHLPTLLAGDFNCVLEGKDQSSTPSNFCKSLFNVCKELNLTDAWRYVHPNEVEFSFFRSSSASRLDRFYVSSHLVQHLKSSEMVPVPFSDHCIVTLSIQSPERLCSLPYGRGTWKLNSSLLHDPNVIKELETLYKSLKKSQSQCQSRMEWWSKRVKPRIKSFFVRTGVQKSKEFNDTYEFLTTFFFPVTKLFK